ncbi:hypothetical protein PENANT_c001G01621 [Penicillium antarcticum]|uniref:Uncharacterized protein n=1 Tax=Penicillium antarcticum TaxID=416450 RepID=A0A1V6QPH1_9EURO|nr:hypothetical protein PENANT_c001G01621 [Penicillium antarcticum]
MATAGYLILIYLDPMLDCED